MSTVVTGIYGLKDMIETVPIQVMMIAVPAAIVVLAGIAAIVARFVEQRVSHDGH